MKPPTFVEVRCPHCGTARAVPIRVEQIDRRSYRLHADPAELLAHAQTCSKRPADRMSPLPVRILGALLTIGSRG